MAFKTSGNTIRYFAPSLRCFGSGALVVCITDGLPETSGMPGVQAIQIVKNMLTPGGASLMLGKTGSLVSDVDEMAEAIQATAHLDRVLCRKTAIERFSANRMTRQYIELYRRIIGRAN